MRILAGFAMIAVLLMSMSAFAEAPDTVRIGNLYADYFGNGIVRVPVFLFNQDTSLGLQVPFLYYCTGGVIHPDSITRAGRIAGTNIFDGYIGLSHGEGTGNPDSIILAAVTFFADPLPPGNGAILDLWFSGGQVGDLMSFEPVDSIDGQVLLIGAPYGEPTDIIHLVTHVAVVESGLEIACGTHQSVEALQTLSFPVVVRGGDSPYDLEIVSLVGPNMSYPPPVLSGNDPWTFTWSPNFYNTGEYVLTLRATDYNNDETTLEVLINVTGAYSDPCDVYRGDLNCDGAVDIADLVFMTDWMFSGGNPPSCGKK